MGTHPKLLHCDHTALCWTLTQVLLFAKPWLTSSYTSPLTTSSACWLQQSPVSAVQEEFINTVWDQQQSTGPSISPDSMYQQDANVHIPSLPSQYSSQSSVDYRCGAGTRSPQSSSSSIFGSAENGEDGDTAGSR